METTNVFFSGLLLIIFLMLLKTVGKYTSPKHKPKKIIYVVETIEKCQEVCELLLKNMKLSALGFDAEWISKNKKRCPVALVQLSTLNHCGLFRLNILKAIPDLLKQILEDENVLKVGIVPERDALFVLKDYGVLTKSTFDLRHLYKHNSGLSGLSDKILDKPLLKTTEVRCSNWETEELSSNQIEYAAQDGFTAYELYEHYYENNDSNLLQSIVDMYLNKPFIIKSNNNPKPNAVYIRKEKTPKISYRKERANCRLFASDNTLLCWVLKRRGLWYVDKNKGEVICENPFTVRLLFETKYKPKEDENLYDKEEVLQHCVVCKSSNNLIRHNIVPRMLKAHIPLIDKMHVSQDIQYLCSNCYLLGEYKNNILKNDLKKMINYQEFNGNEEMESLKTFKLAQKRAKTLLLFANNISQEKAEEMRNYILQNTKIEIINKENLEKLLSWKIDHVCDDKRFASAVVNYFMSENRKISQLKIMCRQYFVSILKPQHLPKYWTIDYIKN